MGFIAHFDRGRIRHEGLDDRAEALLLMTTRSDIKGSDSMLGF